MDITVTQFKAKCLLVEPDHLFLLDRQPHLDHQYRLKIAPQYY